ncbi:MAG: ATP-binding cassette domain-containing protein, partial [Clostridia bacterium]
VNQDEVVLEVGDCDYDERTHHIGIKVYRGEVVGLYGLVGSGRTEFAEAIYGVRRMQHADIVFNGEKIKQCETQKMIDRGMIMTPEKRANAIFASDTLIDNIAILFMGKLCSKFLGFIQPKRNENIALKVLQENKVKYSDPKQAIRELSGGNIQKIIVGRSLNVENISLLIMDEPTTGLDLGAKHDVYVVARRLADEDRISSIFISSELNELLSVCNRIYIFANGNVTGMVERESFDKEYILNAAFRRA